MIEFLRRTGPIRVLTAAPGVPAGTEKRSVPRLIDYLRCTHNHRRLVCSHPAPGMDRSPTTVKFQQRYVMSHRNVVNGLWAKAFGQFCSSHGDHPVSRSVLGA